MFGRGKKDAELPNDSVDLAVKALDLGKYDLDGFRNDVGEIINLPGAMQAIAKRALIITVAVTVVLYLVFAGRLGSVTLFLFMVVAVVLTAVGASAVAVFLLMRTRVDQTVAASSRVVELVEMMHRDYEQVQSGGAQLSIKEVGSEVAQQLVFPALFGAAGQATAMTGFFGVILRPALRLPMRWVERSVVQALEQLPDATVSHEGEPVEGMNEGARADIAADAMATSAVESVRFISDAYQTTQHQLERIVGGLGVTVLGPVGFLVLMSLVPLTLLVLLTWWVT